MMVVRACNQSTQEAEAREWDVRGQSVATELRQGYWAFLPAPAPMFVLKGLNVLWMETSPWFVAQVNSGCKDAWGRKTSAEETGAGLLAGCAIPPASRAAVCVPRLHPSEVALG